MHLDIEQRSAGRRGQAQHSSTAPTCNGICNGVGKMAVERHRAAQGAFFCRVGIVYHLDKIKAAGRIYGGFSCFSWKKRGFS